MFSHLVRPEFGGSRGLLFSAPSAVKGFLTAERQECRDAAEVAVRICVATDSDRDWLSPPYPARIDGRTLLLSWKARAFRNHS